MMNRILIFGLLLIGAAACAQPKEKEPVVMGSIEKRNRMNQAKKARRARREAALQTKYDLNVWIKTITNQGRPEFKTGQGMDSELAIC